MRRTITALHACSFLLITPMSAGADEAGLDAATVYKMVNIDLRSVVFAPVTPVKAL